MAVAAAAPLEQKAYPDWANGHRHRCSRAQKEN